MNHFGQSLKLALWALILLNLLMALGSIWVFMRMSPVIESIIDRNEKSLQASEEMLSQLALTSNPANLEEQVKVFENALKRAMNNITEPNEPAVLDQIQAQYQDAFANKPLARESVVEAIGQLGQINRQAMYDADVRAKQLGFAGAWGVVFMASGVFLAGLLLQRFLALNLVRPLNEIHEVLMAHHAGDPYRRAVTQALPNDVRPVLDELNHFLDQLEKEHAQQGFKKPQISGNTVVEPTPRVG
ncbi:MAG: hypothetical protein A2508_04080 [Candidatus Lambdaproteobacteria bacterium RIFOXYD12_FULL_49_8]|uniref:HAMP domain-containing protein n=1 Tax=Candidatus Lambdaproteobacteria bacterium RIFOXYD2_FULL_50_16 TaxID=1817772 RepID=A0A1F6GED6_9PROT|nr:MAG: hypothetical protein A2527_01925 [Candidatus Lambdaproteobacteria bacterium RIFOXYD2_FULL_50_16]OGG98167.1 MAG: hypothetical protein A2508_04080 [Candidatus Lambdaproteobacteria bacterium RIFOXYD12_FULL_49_8]